MITNGGWLWAAFSFWQVEGVIRWRVIKGGERSVIEGFFGEFLKRWIKDFDRYFPTRGLDSLRRWLWSFAWFHNPHHGRLFLTGPTADYPSTKFAQPPLQDKPLGI